MITGRDGENSVCEILFDPSDLLVLQNFAYGDTPTQENVRDFVLHVMKELKTDDEGTFSFSVRELSMQFGITIIIIVHSLQLSCGAVIMIIRPSISTSAGVITHQ